MAIRSLRRFRSDLDFQRRRLAYHLWWRWTGHDLRNQPPGTHCRIHFSPPPGETGGETLWAEKVGRYDFKLRNNGFMYPVAVGDVVRAKVKWPYFEFEEIVTRARRTVRIEFDLPWPTSEERTQLNDALLKRGGEIEWGYPDLLSVSFPLDSEPHELLTGLLDAQARIFHIDP